MGTGGSGSKETLGRVKGKVTTRQTWDSFKGRQFQVSHKRHGTSVTGPAPWEKDPHNFGIWTTASEKDEDDGGTFAPLQHPPGPQRHTAAPVQAQACTGGLFLVPDWGAVGETGDGAKASQNATLIATKATKRKPEKACFHLFIKSGESL